MMIAFATIGSALLLLAEGWLLVTLILRTREEKLLRVCLGFPAGTLLNALLFFLLNLTGIPLRLPGVLIAHGVVILILIILRVLLPCSRTWKFPDVADHLPRLPLAILIICAVLLAIIATISILTVFTIPSFHWDTFTNWAMRSRISFDAGTFLMEGVTQPQYPILLHSLQILPMTLMGEWHDKVANIMTMMLTLSGFSSLFLLLRRSIGTHMALLSLTLLLSIPITVIHLRQGYADTHLAVFALLSALLLTFWVKEKDPRFLVLSAIFIVAAAWTKFEGLYAGLIPWLCAAIFTLPSGKRGKLLRVLPIILLCLPWPIFIFFADLPLAPHATTFQFHPESFALIFQHLFTMGMFGFHWWAIVTAVLLAFFARPKFIINMLQSSPILLWGILATLVFALAYIFTNEVRGLIQGDNFARAMMLPTMLLTLGCILFMQKHKKSGI